MSPGRQSADFPAGEINDPRITDYIKFKDACNGLLATLKKDEDKAIVRALIVKIDFAISFLSNPDNIHKHRPQDVRRSTLVSLINPFLAQEGFEELKLS